MGLLEGLLGQFEAQMCQLKACGGRLEAHLGSLEAYFMEVLANLRLNWENMKP